MLVLTRPPPLITSRLKVSLFHLPRLSRRKLRTVTVTAMPAAIGSTYTNASQDAAWRQKLFESMKIDVLTPAQEAENDKARHQVSRTFTCEYVYLILRSHCALTFNITADTLTGISLVTTKSRAQGSPNALSSPLFRDAKVCLPIFSRR
jgi:hypothetical protein